MNVKWSLDDEDGDDDSGCSGDHDDDGDDDDDDDDAQGLELTHRFFYPSLGNASS